MLIILCCCLLASAVFLAASLHRSRARLQEIQEQNARLYAAQNELQEFALTQLVRGNAPRFELLDAYDTVFHLDFPSNAFMVLTVKIRRHPYGPGEDAQAAAAAAVREELSGILGLYHKLHFLELDGLMVCLYCEANLTLEPGPRQSSPEQQQLLHLLVLHCEACAASLQENHDIDVLISAGQYDTGGFALHNNYLFSKSLLEQAMRAKWEGNVISSETTLQQVQDVVYLDARRQFYNCFICFQYEDAAACLFHMVQLRMQNYLDSFSEAKEVVASQLRFCTDMLELPLNIQLDLPDGGSIQIRDVIQGSENPEQLRLHLQEYFAGLALHNGRQRSQATPFTERVHALIEASYMDNQLSVSGISEELGLSVSYLSRQFKQEYGCGVLEFIHKTRIARARELLSAGVSPNDCYAQVGYASRRTFDSAFSRYEGITPKAWQARIQGEDLNMPAEKN